MSFLAFRFTIPVRFGLENIITMIFQNFLHVTSHTGWDSKLGRDLSVTEYHGALCLDGPKIYSEKSLGGTLNLAMLPGRKGTGQGPFVEDRAKS